MAVDFPRNPASSRCSSSHFARQFAGILQQKNERGEILTSQKHLRLWWAAPNELAGKRIYADHELIVGRDSSRCQYVIDEPVVSSKHIRIYTVVFEKDNPAEIPPLVYAEDLSLNGTYWNGSLIGKGNGGFLLSNGDTLRVSSQTYFTFSRSVVDVDPVMFGLTQEKEMKHFKNEYLITDRLLGSGAFGKVFMAIEKATRTQLACKVVDLRKLKPQPRARFGRLERPAAAEDVDCRLQLRKVRNWVDQQKGDNRLEDKLKIYYREAEILASINHPNIISLEKVYITDNTMYMFQDLVTAGDLFSYLQHKNGRLLEVEAAVIIRQVLIAVDFLHNKNIIHRDLKPENVLMTSLAAGSRVVLTDFGASRSIHHGKERMSTLVGTAGYTAPEVLSHKTLPISTSGYTRAVDMWSLGCLTVLLLTGGLAFVDPRTGEHSEKLANDCNLASLEKCPEWTQVRARPKDFVKNLLVIDEQARLGAHEALEHAWFSNEFHKTNFEDLYKSTTRHWRPRTLRQPIIEFVDADSIKRLPCSQGFVEATSKKARRKSQLPVEPPYIPFPRNMHQPFFPQRATGGYVMSHEVMSAIQENWTFKRNPKSAFEAEEEPLLPTTPVQSSKSPLLDSRVPTETGRHTPRKSQAFKPLYQRTPSTRFGTEKGFRVEKVSNHLLKSIEEPDTSYLDLRASRAFSPSAWLKDQSPDPASPAATVSHEGCTPSQASPDLPSGQTIPLRPLTICVPRSESASECDSLLAHYQGEQEIDVKERFTQLDDSNSESKTGEDGQDSPMGLKEATPLKKNPKLRLKSQSVGKRVPSNTPNTKKRRRGSVFDIEEDEQENEEDDDAEGSEREPKRLRAGRQVASRIETSNERRMKESDNRQARDATPFRVATDLRDALSNKAHSQPYLPRL